MGCFSLEFRVAIVLLLTSLVPVLLPDFSVISAVFPVNVPNTPWTDFVDT